MEAAKSRHAQLKPESCTDSRQTERRGGCGYSDTHVSSGQSQGSGKTQFNIRPTVLMSPHCWMLKSGRGTLCVFEKGDPHQVHPHTLVCAHLGKQELPHAVTPTWRCVDVHLDGPVCRDEHEASMKMYTHTQAWQFLRAHETQRV